MGSQILIALATYNERENLPMIVEAIFDTVPQCNILVVDDNSPDGSGDWVAEQSQHESRLKLIRRGGKLGLGTAVLAAVQYAVANDYDYLINLDADLSHPVAAIPAMLQKADEGIDVVIGSRYIEGGAVENWAWYRRLMSRCINAYARIWLGLKTRDNSGSFRCYRVEVLKKISSAVFVSTGYSFFEEMLYRLKRVGATFAEVPITFTERRFGQSKINKKEAIAALWSIFVIVFLQRNK